jgi:uncharacterized membrane protein
MQLLGGLLLSEWNDGAIAVLLFIAALPALPVFLLLYWLTRKQRRGKSGLYKTIFVLIILFVSIALVYAFETLLQSHPQR